MGGRDRTMNLEPMWFPECAGKPYRPSNGSEGDIFMSNFCYKCIHDDMENEDYCHILNRTFVHEPEDEEYPKEWIYNQEGRPICTAFEDQDKWGIEIKP